MDRFPKLLKAIFCGLVVSFLFVGCGDDEEEVLDTYRTKVLLDMQMDAEADQTICHKYRLKKKPIHLEFEVVEDSYKEKSMAGLKMPGMKTTTGKMVRALRFENIAKVVEARYCLQENVILALVMQETRGEDCRPNQSSTHPWGDGGFGICHMQGVVGEEYGLNTVCNPNCGEKHSKFVCFKHAAMLGQQMYNDDKCDRKLMIDRDDRLHPVLNLDAVGRMLALAGGSLENKVKRYRGGSTKQRNLYWDRVSQYMRLLDSKTRRTKVQKEFNKLNNDKLKIGGEIVRKDAFKQYIAEHQRQNVNYGMLDYVELGKCECVD